MPTEDARSAVEVTEASTEERERAEHEGGGAHYPGQGGLTDLEVGLDGGKSEVGDGLVEHDAELRF